MVQYSKDTATELVAARTSLVDGGEEIANSITHVLGVILSLIALVVLLDLSVGRGDALATVSFAIYGTSLSLLYISSSLYHGLDGPYKRVLRLFDHSSIYILIAGTYTPITLLGLRGAWGWTLFCLVWAMAAGGITVNLLLLGKSKRFERVGVALYIGMGWLAIVAIKPMLDRLPVGMILWILAGGLSYTLGVTFYAWKGLPYHHAIWHLFVLGGSACHFVAVVLYLVPGR